MILPLLGVKIKSVSVSVSVCACVCVCVCVCVCARALLAEVAGVGRTCVPRNGTFAYLLIYSSDTCLHNAHHSLPLSLFARE